MKVSELIIRAAKKYGDYDENGSTDDEKYDRIKVEDWLEYYLAALSQLVLVRPDVNIATGPIKLVAGTKQTIPSDGLRFIDISRNLGDDGLTPGTPVTPIDRYVMDELISTWHSATGETSIDNYMFDLKTPKIFFNTPPVHATTDVYVDMNYSKSFDEVLIDDIETDDIECDDTFINPVEDWMMKSAYEIDTDSPVNWNRSIKYEESFYRGLGIEFKSSAMISTKRK
jgi:hypothetical protein